MGLLRFSEERPKEVFGRPNISFASAICLCHANSEDSRRDFRRTMTKNVLPSSLFGSLLLLSCVVSSLYHVHVVVVVVAVQVRQADIIIDQFRIPMLRLKYFRYTCIRDYKACLHRNPTTCDMSKLYLVK